MTDEAHEHVLARWPADWLSDHCEDEHGLDPMGGDIADFAELERWHVAAHGYRIIGPEDEETLREVRDELARWGWGDFHYGSQPQEQRVVDAVAKLDALLRGDET